MIVHHKLLSLDTVLSQYIPFQVLTTCDPFLFEFQQIISTILTEQNWANAHCIVICFYYMCIHEVKFCM